MDATNSSRNLQPLISSEIKYLLEICINVLAFLVTSLIGIAANVLNITVYWKMGLKDSITLGFFSLSISDLILVFMTFCTALWYALKMTEPVPGVDFQSIHYVSSATVRNMFYSMSSVLTAFLCVERCFCVIFPFKVRVIFSRKRSLIMILAIVLLHFLCFLPLFATHQLRWQHRPMPGFNGSRIIVRTLRVYFLPYRQELEYINTILAGIVLPTAAQFIVIVCIIILIRGLRASSKFRQVATNTTATLQIASAPDSTGSEKDSMGDGATNGKLQNDAAGNLTTRDARLVKTMVLLIIIFTISNIPLLIITYAKRLVPELNFRRRFHNTVTTSYSIIYLLSAVNATANVFVYYHTSTKFREVTDKLFACTSSKGK